MRLRAVTLAAAVVALSIGAAASSAAPTDICFGAAARDPAHDPCQHPRPRRDVRPTPAQALLDPGPPCTSVERVGPVTVCGFGVAAVGSAGAVALVGDSHAAHWREAIEVVAQAERWHGVLLTFPGCPLSLALRNLPDPQPAQCLAWSRAVIAWLGRHPEVHTLFVSEFATRSRVIVPPGGDPFAAEANGYAQAWNALPASIAHIVVLRDVPRMHARTSQCVEQAMVLRQLPDSVCAVRRTHGMRPDAAATAARRWSTNRVQLIDMTHFFCGRRKCYPVVGGALLYKDSHHLTSVYSATLGPFVLRKLQRLMAGW
jgi:hypothetical protein